MHYPGIVDLLFVVAMYTGMMISMTVLANWHEREEAKLN